ncbi:hypothetical protein [Nostoc sp. CCY0012]|uniref:hypothetical protein n=1 Tax=Nostoc sp. CCY0012 TaxID=1056123 RepID=UPI0039C63A7C
MNHPGEISSSFSKIELEKQKEGERIRDVNLLLTSLITREETTVKLILDCLYDVGSINLINHKFRSRTLNTTLKLISHTSKPVFKILAWRWVKKNCPQLITNWLQSKVTFKSPTMPNTQLVTENPDLNLNYLAPPQYQLQEVKHLRSQVKLLTGLLAGILAVFGGSFVWLGYSLERSHMQRIVELQTQVKTLEASVNQP